MVLHLRRWHSLGLIYSLIPNQQFGAILREDRSSEKYYVLGVLPYLFSTFAGSTLGAYMSQVVSETTVFSFAAFFLFSATLPLFYAPETLSEKVLKDMDLMSYVEKAKKKAESETKKTDKKDGN